MTRRTRTIEWSPMLTVHAAEGRSGLAWLREIAAGEVAQPPV